MEDLDSQNLLDTLKSSEHINKRTYQMIRFTQEFQIEIETAKV